MQIDSTELRYSIKTSTTLCPECIESSRSDSNRTDRNTHQSTKNGVTERQRQICAHPTAFSVSTFNSCLIDVWWGWNKWWEGIENGKRTATDHTETLNQKRRYGTPTPHLRPSDSIFLIYIRLSFDWCMIQIKQLVRRDRNRKKGRQLTRQIHLPLNQKRRYGSPRRIYSNPTVFSVSAFDSCSIDVWYK